MTIKIGHPYIEQHDNEVRCIAHVTNEIENYDLDLYYSVEPEYGKYLCAEQADAFVLPLLLRGVITNQNICVDAPMSEKLYHNLQYGVLYALAKAYQREDKNDSITTINIFCQRTSHENYHGAAVGTGCSLGVDSFSVIKKYLFDNKSFPDYRISHFAVFNVGAFGSDNTELTRKSFLNGVMNARLFAEKLGLPVVSVDTNLHQLYPEHNFNWSHTYVNMGCVLSLQKLWGHYLFASGYPVDDFQFSFKNTAHFESFLLPCFSTESTELIHADMEKSRSKKLHYIMDEQIVRENLNVCLKEQHKNDGKKHDKQDDTYLNCGRCEKCLRTMLQLDIYNRLNNYTTTFNLSHWKRKKQFYLAKVMARKNSDDMYKDIYDSIPDNYHIPLSAYILSWIYKLKDFVLPL